MLPATPPAYTVPRKHPRLSTHAPARIHPIGLDAEVLNVSRGGVFVRLTPPPPRGDRVDLEAWSPVGDTLRVAAQVMHSRSGEGAGLRFLELDAVNEEVLERWLAAADGMDLVVAGTGPTAEDPVPGALAFLRGVAEGRPYDVLGVSPLSEVREIVVALERLQARWAEPVHGEGQRTLDQAREVAHDLRAELSDRRRRLRADFRRGIVLAEERLRQAHYSPSLVELRLAWLEVFPDRFDQATRAAEEAATAAAASQFDRAVTRGESAIADDPFNVPLRRLVSGWRARQRN